VGPPTAATRGRPGATSARFVPVEQQWTEISVRAVPSTQITAIRREQKLVSEYRDHLVKQRHVVARLEINVDGTVLRSDLVDRTRLALIEAKGQADRDSIRTALGQIIDYERFMAPPPKHRGVLLPTKPTADLLALIAAAGVTAIWPTARGFADTSGGALT
jgi:hypothetical protein